MDSLLPFLQGLAPLQHAGLARRTPGWRYSNRDSLLAQTGKNTARMLLVDSVDRKWTMRYRAQIHCYLVIC